MRIEATELSIAYGERIVLQSLSLTIETGATLAVTGASGSGKSTLLAALAGLIRPTSGTVQAHPPPTDLLGAVCWVPQGSNSLPNRSALANVMIGGLASGLRRDEAHRLAHESLESVGLSDHVSALARTLSGGELQRVAVARAMCSQRPFIFADEPTGSLDKAASSDVAAALQVAANHGKGVVIATHDLAVASQADRRLRL